MIRLFPPSKPSGSAREYPTPPSIFLKQGSFLHGEWWNAIGSFRAVCGAPTRRWQWPSRAPRRIGAFSRTATLVLQKLGLGRWLNEPSPALDGFSSIQVIEQGQTDRIWRLLYFLESGEPG